MVQKDMFVLPHLKCDGASAAQANFYATDYCEKVTEKYTK